jgi:DNA-binding response OmpR family regulator
MRQAPLGAIPPRSSRRALVVVRDPDAAHALEDILHFFGFETRTGSSIEEVLAITDDFRPAIAIIDITSPSIAGVELVKRLRAKQLNDCKFVALSRKFGVDRAQRTVTEFDATLYKPISLEALLGALVASGSAVLA